MAPSGLAIAAIYFLRIDLAAACAIQWFTTNHSADFCREVGEHRCLRTRTFTLAVTKKRIGRFSARITTHGSMNCVLGWKGSTMNKHKCNSFWCNSWQGYLTQQVISAWSHKNKHVLTWLAWGPIATIQGAPSIGMYCTPIVWMAVIETPDYWKLLTTTPNFTEK
jgi:hypothetical protein